jgi:cytochrome c oxidase assembly protein subunit 15
MVGGILFEHGHRMIAAPVGPLTLALAISLVATEPRRWVRWLGFGAFLAVVLQGVLGGITVLLLPPKSVSIGHALLAQGFFVMTVLLAQATAPGWPALVASSREAADRSSGSSSKTIHSRWLGVTLIAALEGELLLGAAVRHNAAGPDIPDFPLALGRIVPPFDYFLVTIHYLHRVGAALVLVLAAATVWTALQRHSSDWPMRRRMALLVLFAVVQVSLGASIIWTERGLAVTTLHVVNGALLMAAAVSTTLRAWMLECPDFAR